MAGFFIGGNMDYDSVRATVIKTTDKAVLFDFSGQEMWVPRSVIEEGEGIEDIDSFHGEQIFEIQTWFCEKEL